MRFGCNFCAYSVSLWSSYQHKTTEITNIHSKMPEETDKDSNKGPVFSVNLNALSSILKEMGLPSFLLIIIVFIFLFLGTSAQHQEFIDRFILLKGASSDPFPFALVVSVLVAIIIVGGYYMRLDNKKLKEEIKRISAEKSELQKQLLGTELPTSE